MKISKERAVKPYFLLVVLALLISGICSLSYAEPIPELMKLFKDHLSMIDCTDNDEECGTENSRGLRSYSDDSSAPESEEADDAMFFKNFWFRIRSQTIISIPGFVSINFQPEIEMLWQKPYPDGWSKYEP